MKTADQEWRQHKEQVVDMNEATDWKTWTMFGQSGISARRSVLLARIAELEAMRASGCCMCGDSDEHSLWIGHAPVNDVDYYISLAQAELAALS